jgi:hypothetical protein
MLKDIAQGFNDFLVLILTFQRVSAAREGLSSLIFTFDSTFLSARGLKGISLMAAKKEASKSALALTDFLAVTIGKLSEETNRIVEW